MNSLNYCLVITSSILVLFLLDRTTAAPNKCVFKCLKGVIKCKRDIKVPGLLPPGTDCCDLYTECYMTCDPTATSLPKCQHNHKRGSWNKRVPPIFNMADVQPRSEFNAPPIPAVPTPTQSDYYRAALNYLLQNNLD